MNTFLHTMLEPCVLAYESDTAPILFLNTHDSALVDRLVLLGSNSGLLVPLALPSLQDSCQLTPYLTHFRIQPGQLVSCRNLFYDHLPEEGFDEAFVSVFYVESDRHVPLLRQYLHQYHHNLDPNSPLHRSCVICYGDFGLLPPDLQLYMETVEERYPTSADIHRILLQLMEEAGLPAFETAETGEAIARELTGFRFSELLSLLRRLLLPQRGSHTPRLFLPEQRIAMIRSVKANMLRKEGGLLELVEPEREQDTLCNMDRYLDWVHSLADQMADPRKHKAERGSSAPMGCLICGIAGTGKSEAARLLGPAWGLPTVKLRLDRILDSYLGQSEKHLASALELAEHMAPMVLWVDEIDKKLSGISASDKTNATLQRMTGQLLEWMTQDHGCFLVATANDVTKLPDELLRKGRFSMLFSTDLPNEAQCRALFREHMHRAEHTRALEAVKQGKPVPPPRFSRDPRADCYGDNTMAAILSLFGRGRFLRPADIAELVSEALNSLPESSLTPMILPNAWLSAIRKVSDKRTTDVSSPDSLHKIAASYIRLLRGSFEPVSSDSLFDRAHYHPGAEQLYDTEDFQSDSAYDTALFHALAELINTHGPAYEKRLQEQAYQ